MSYITTSDVRRASGISSTSVVSDADVASWISLVENETERKMNTKFSPTEKIDILDGTGSERIFVTKIPLLKVKELVTNDTDIDVSTLSIYRDSGKIRLGISSGISSFLEKARDTKIKYLFGMVDETSTTTTSSADVTDGTTKTVTVAATTGFTANDYVKIIGTDGYEEVAKISTVNIGVSLVLDSLSFHHESGSIITKLEIPTYIKRFMELEAAIAIACQVIGVTYSYNVAYSMPELSVQKSVPLQHFITQFEKNVQERDALANKIKPRFHITC